MKYQEKVERRYKRMERKMKRREAWVKTIDAASRKKFLAQIRYYKAGIAMARLLLKHVYPK